ncbi:hypothetical protein JKP88DRAFT_261002 [Tribonema minus]|uniref:Uncharacterized protein n=1 Tax=Tribonema minus TaxID=303371 RepID=A0A835Z3U0_9STRA|nr:hypothetical protein JKP88DRAFT_261002 [Tribonema minus]
MAGSMQDVVAQEVQLQVEESSRSTSSEDTRERKSLMENEAYRRHLLLRCGVPTTLPIKLTGGQRVSKLHDVLARTAVGKATARSYQALYTGFKLMRAALAELIGLGLTELPQGSRTFMSEMEVCEVMLAKFETLVVHQEGVTISDADLAAIQGAIHSDLDEWTSNLDALSTSLLQHHRLAPPFGSGEALDVPDIPTVAWTNAARALDVNGDIAARAVAAARKRKYDGAFRGGGRPVGSGGGGAGAGGGTGAAAGAGGTRSQPRGAPANCPYGVCWVWWRHVKEQNPVPCNVVPGPCKYRHFDT